jgi:hypothetical protein
MSISPAFQRCCVVVVANRPKVAAGKYFPDSCVGVYGFRGKKSFAIPSEVRPSMNFYRGLRSVPFFVVDPETSLALPVGKSFVDDIRLAAKIEVATQAKYVKALVLRVFDLVQTIIIALAGAGALFFILHLISTFTGHPISY